MQHSLVSASVTGILNSPGILPQTANPSFQLDNYNEACNHKRKDNPSVGRHLTM